MFFDDVLDGEEREGGGRDGSFCRAAESFVREEESGCCVGDEGGARGRHSAAGAVGPPLFDDVFEAFDADGEGDESDAEAHDGGVGVDSFVLHKFCRFVCG